VNGNRNLVLCLLILAASCSTWGRSHFDMRQIALLEAVGEPRRLGSDGSDEQLDVESRGCRDGQCEKFCPTAVRAGARVW
jgi:hypothetical protein